MKKKEKNRESYKENFTIKITKTQKEILNNNTSVAAEIRVWIREYIDFYEMKNKLRYNIPKLLINLGIYFKNSIYISV